MTRTRNTLIIGGGIAGPAAAMALQKAGIDPVVYEAHPTGADGIGGFLTLASNGVDALRVLAADKPALAAGFPTPGITLRSGTGKRLGESRTGGSLPDGTTSQTIKRADLYRVLHVIGDAAHAPSPTSGQGASLSIEDAVVLAKSLRDLPSPQAAFARFAASRRPRVERIIKWAARINNSKAAGPIARMFRDAMLPMILTMTTDSKALKQTSTYHIDWDTPTPAAA
jgi:2-polyprenyl-6-methoxyphenol hydroxylase-like FAD-dependent oxidoreductase